MGDIVSLSKFKDENRPHWAGNCVCLQCRHQWMAVGPIPVNENFECPQCKTFHGVPLGCFAAPVGAAVLRCDCGCEALTAYIRESDGLKVLRCMACGDDLTEAYFG